MKSATSLTNRGLKKLVHNRRAIPVVVIDLLTKKSESFKSLNHAARSLNEHPKSLWRYLKSKKTYNKRYLIRKEEKDTLLTVRYKSRVLSEDFFKPNELKIGYSLRNNARIIISIVLLTIGLTLLIMLPSGLLEDEQIEEIVEEVEIKATTWQVPVLMILSVLMFLTLGWMIADREYMELVLLPIPEWEWFQNIDPSVEEAMKPLGGFEVYMKRTRGMAQIANEYLEMDLTSPQVAWGHSPVEFTGFWSKV